MKHTRPLEDLGARLGALGEAWRLRLLRLLEAEELSVGEIARVMQLPQSTVSRRLKALADGGWIARRSEGTATLYRFILDDLDDGARAVWLAVREHLGADPQLEEDRRRLHAVVAERRVDSQTFFGRVAGEWDSVRESLFGHGFTAPGLLSLLPADWEVADLGCGAGNVAELLAPVVRRVIAVDQSPAMLEAARQRLGEAPNVDVREGDLLALPIEDQAVDAAIFALALHHVPDVVGALREARRILRSGRGGGVVLVLDMAEHGRDEYRQLMGHAHLGFSDGQMRDAMEQAGFMRLRVCALRSDPEAKGPGLTVATGHLT
ncbi:MAG: ArsR/SmtB family transcription factor [Phycisphaerales bacterium JB039]